MGEGLKGPGVGLDPGDLVGVIFRIPLAFFFCIPPLKAARQACWRQQHVCFWGMGRGGATGRRH